MHILTLDTRAPPIERDFLALGDGGLGPAGRLAVNSRCIERDGQAWMPVMGEFHYSRCPASEWADELQRLRAGGIDIVASYVFWNHHEAAQGHFDWTGQRHLRHFAELAHAAGLMFYLRPGPWVHAEARNGGLPDWLQAMSPLRCNDPRYLGHVQRFFGEIGRQLQGLLWCDGGPLVGVQIENEYDGSGPGRGAEHIAELKRMAQASGLRVPLWTVTGWPTLDIPPREVLPVSGAYPDGFWGGGTGPQPPSGVFAFNTGRCIGEMGNVGGTAPEGRIDPAHYPFFLAEAGGGMQVSYHRRPVLSTDDVAACALVQIGSGANLYGYYMFHGGANPGRGLQETQASGYPNDVAEIGYDFRAPLGQYGQVRASYGRLRTLHSFMAAFGSDLALMSTSVGTGGGKHPDPADLQQLRFAARAAGDSGFVFVNNHCRHHRLPDFPGVQLHLRRDDGVELTLPSRPVDLPSGAYFIWPLGQRLGAARMQHASVQPLTRWAEGGTLTWVGFVVPGVPAELCFDADTVRELVAPDGTRLQRHDGRLTLHGDPTMPLPQVLALTDALGATHRIVLLSQDQADACSRQYLLGRERLLLCQHALHLEADTAIVLAHGEAEVQAWPADDLGAGPGFARWSQPAPRPDTLVLATQLLQDSQQPPPRRDGPRVAWRGRSVPLAPDESAYQAGLRVSLVPQAACPPQTRVMLSLDYLGDAARLLADGVLVDDQFADGEPWLIGLHRFARADGSWPRFELQIVPADPTLPIFLEDAARQRLQAAAPRRAALLAAEVRLWRRARLQFHPRQAPTWLA